MKIEAKRYHDFCAGHRVVGHESKCRNLHGHNYRVWFSIAQNGGNLDQVGRVMDFSVVKDRLCQWLEIHWDHRMLIWKNDPLIQTLISADPSVVILEFNPTAENMAQHLLEVVGPRELTGTGCYLAHVSIEETRKCSVEAWV